MMNQHVDQLLDSNSWTVRGLFTEMLESFRKRLFSQTDFLLEDVEITKHLFSQYEDDAAH